MGTEVPLRLNFQNLRVACSHGHLKKVTVMLKVDRVTDPVGNFDEDRPFWCKCL